MFKWFRKEVVVRDEVAQKIADMLFPEPVTRNEDGHEFLIDYSVDHNLYSALVDLQEGVNDETTQDTIQKVIDKLREARQMLQAEYQINEKARYLLVDTPDNKDK